MKWRDLAPAGRPAWAGLIVALELMAGYGLYRWLVHTEGSLVILAMYAAGCLALDAAIVCLWMTRHVREPIPTWLRVTLGVVATVIIFGLYTELSRQRRELNPKDKSIPGWGQLAEAFKTVVTPQGNRKEIYLFQDGLATAERLALGLAVGVSLSVTLGLLMGVFQAWEAFFLPALSFLAKIAPTAMLAVFFILVGIKAEMYVAMLTFGTLPTLAQAVHQAVKSDVPEELIFKSYTLGASHVEVIWNVILRQILPRVLEAIRLQVGPAMVLLVAAEWMVAGEGFGYRLRLYYQRTDMTVVYVYLIFLGIAGYSIDLALSKLRRWLCGWFEK